MDVNGEEGGNPKKIVALKVPSLFIKSSSSTTKVSDEVDCAEGQSSDTPKSTRRPMPASAKRKLESDNPGLNVKVDDDGKKEVNITPETVAQSKSHRPMPASLKKKLEQESLALSQSPNNGDAQSETGITNTGTNGKDNTEKKPNKPMPASARKKLEKRDEEPSTHPPGIADNNSETRDSITSTDSESNKHKPAKPMPASVRKKLEQVGAVPSPSEFNSNHEESSVKIVESSAEKKVTRPMPASARRKLEVKPEPDHEDGNKVAQSTDSKDWKPEHIGAANEDSLDSSHVQASGEMESGEKLRTKEENEDSKINSDESKKESKKITISLDGIKFPTFSKPKPKPMPASARRKMEENDVGTGKDTKLDAGHFETESQEKTCSSPLDDEKPVQTEGRRSRRGGCHEVVALVDAKYECQFCGAEFYNLYSKKAHELNVHIEKKEKPKSDTAKKSNKKKSSKPLKYKDNKCPNCDRVVRDRKKLYKHVSRCGKSQDIPCPHCDQKFLFQNELAIHVKKVHTRTSVTKTIKSEQQITSDHVTQNSPSSPGSAKSYGNESKTSKHSVVEKSKPMPVSVKAKLEKESGGPKHSEAKEDKKDQSNTFKRKIADVLSNMGSRFRNFNSHLDEDDNQSDDEGPPKKKMFTPNDSVGQESIRGRPMPAAVRKKLEERTKVKTTTPEPDISELDDLECEVCHKIFTKFHTRKKHERNVHFIRVPRGRNQLSEPVPSSEPSFSETVPEPEPDISDNEPEPEPRNKYDFDFKSIPSGVGKCPICGKFLTKVKKHVKKVHKISETNTMSATSSSANVSGKRPIPLVRPSAPKSYKIYKTSTSKAKKKFATSSPTKAPTLTLERLDTPKEKAHIEEKPKEKKIAAPKGSKDEIPEIKGDLSEHMLMRQPKKKRVINCKLCSHLFSHEEDFIMHMQFKHQELIAGVNLSTIKTETEAKLKTASDPKSSSNTSVSGSRSRTRAKQSESSVVENENEKVSEAWGSGSKLDFDNIMLYEKALNQEACVNISSKERKLADDARKEGARKSSEGDKETNKRRSSARIRIPSPEPEPMDTYDDHFDDSMDVEPDPIDEIAITSTYSQKPTSPKKVGLDEMPCSTCDEVFYSYEALRKHELYIHNVKTSRMCPICGVYPTKLSRHLLAHENKTVRCSCIPCRVNFQDFSEVLKHNLTLHPGPEGVAPCATNKPEEIREDATSTSQTRLEDRIISCKLCKKTFTSRTNARRHVRIVHVEITDDVENYVEVTDGTTKYPKASTESKPENSFERLSKIQMESKLNDEHSAPVTRRSSRPMPASARSKITEIDDVENSSKSGNETSKPKKPMPASIRAKLELAKTMELDSGTESNSSKSAVDKPKPSRPMPASIRAKLELAKAKESADSSNESNSSKSEVSKSKPTRAMPASVRAKLEAAKQSDTSSETNSVVDKRKPSRPMPASVRAKLLTESSKVEETHTSNSDSTPTPKRSRPMPASVRAKLQKPEEEEEPKPKSPPPKEDSDDDDDVVPIDEPMVEEANSPEVIDLDDDNDSYHEAEPEPSPPSVPTFSIADEIAEHDKAVRLAMDQNVDYGVSLMYQCKLCDKQFDTHDSTRRHIRRIHREYGPDHTENLIHQVYEPETTEISRTRLRKAVINYQEEDEEDEEVYTPRGTTRRPKAPPPDWNSTPKPAKFHLDDGELLFACKICGKRMASGGNVRRHIHKAHKEAFLSMPLSSDGVVELRPGETFTVDDSNNSHNSAPTWGGMHGATSSAIIATPLANVTEFECKLCGTRISSRFGIRRHIQKGHPEVSDSAEEYILEVGRNDDQLHSSSHNDEPMNISGESDYVYNNDEGEICMEDMVGVGQISISTSSRIQIIEQPKSVSLNRTFSTENTNGDDVIIAKKSKPGPASRKSASQKVVEPKVTSRAEENEDLSAEKDKGHSENEEEESNVFQDKGNVSTGFPYHADLSSLFPALSESRGGLEAMDDIDGGMSLD